MTKISIIHIPLLMLILFAETWTVSAQRTSVGQSSIQTEFLVNSTSFGAEAVFSQYTLSGYWETGLLFNDRNINSDGQYSIDCAHWSCLGGYMFRYLANRSRSINAYCGGGIFLGMQILDYQSRLPDHMVLNQARNQFLYGAYLRLAFEFFVSESIALTLGGSGYVNSTCKTGLLSCHLASGFKFVF